MTVTTQRPASMPHVTMATLMLAVFTVSVGFGVVLCRRSWFPVFLFFYLRTYAIVSSEVKENHLAALLPVGTGLCVTMG